MTSILFHTPSETVRISGAERDWARYLCSKLFEGIIDLDGFGDCKDRILSMVSPTHYLRSGKFQEGGPDIRLLKGALSFHLSPSPLVWNGKVVDLSALHLNTALTLGSDAVCFMAVMAALCEVHGYVKGADRKWLAAILEAGLREGVCRAEKGGYDGWQGLVTLLRASARDPVVMSYSVCEAFPRRGRWSKAFAALDPSLRICPGNLRERFGHGLSALDLVAADWQARLNGVFVE